MYESCVSSLRTMSPLILVSDIQQKLYLVQLPEAQRDLYIFCNSKVTLNLLTLKMLPVTLRNGMTLTVTFNQDIYKNIKSNRTWCNTQEGTEVYPKYLSLV